MPSDLTTVLSGWTNFFVAAAGASAVLLGLVFIGLTIHLEGRKEQPMLVPMAIGSATTLFYPVVVSLILLIPPAQPWLPTVALLVMTLFATQSAAAPIVNRELRSRWIDRRRWSDYVRYGIPLVSSLVLIVCAMLLLVDPTLALYLIAIVIVLYLVVGVQNAWNLLLFGRFELGLKGIPHSDEESSDGR
jgi:hypothetical protein